MDQLRGEGGFASIDPALKSAFMKQCSPFSTQLDNNSEYSQEEMTNFVLQELRELEGQCLRILSKCSQANLQHPQDNYNPQLAWPHVEQLEPWKRMVEYWSEHADTSFAQTESSTRKVEFRRFFRIVKIQLPFRSLEFEKRMYDVRHWAHPQFQRGVDIVRLHNVIHDSTIFPVEKDPAAASQSRVPPAAVLCVRLARGAGWVHWH